MRACFSVCDMCVVCGCVYKCACVSACDGELVFQCSLLAVMADLGVCVYALCLCVEFLTDYSLCIKVYVLWFMCYIT